MTDLRSIRGSAGFFFIRHGESEGNKAGLMQGRTNSALTGKGREQAREAGRWLRASDIEVVLSSPLARARETAEIIAGEAGVAEVRLLDDLVELDTGIFSTLSHDQARVSHPDAWKAFMTSGWEGVPGAEKIESLLFRAEKLWGSLIELVRGGAKNILSVSHAGFIQWIIRWTLGCKDWMPLISISGNCGISLLSVENVPLGGEAGLYSYYANWTMINVVPAAAARVTPL
jgi:broad specificity phosphatase PhoE